MKKARSAPPGNNRCHRLFNRGQTTITISKEHSKPQFVPITKQNHTEKSWIRFSSYTFASKDNLAPLARTEIAKAVSALPMAFVKQQNRFFLAAIISLTPGTNLFVGPDGRWLGKDIPSVFRGYPFQLAKTQGHDNLVLCVDEASGLVNADKSADEQFFDAAGEVSRPVKYNSTFPISLDTRMNGKFFKAKTR